MYRALEKGLSFKTTFGNVLTLTPPLTVTEPEMMRALDILSEAIGEAAKQ
jgi:4-aminobutyrate aminotransferase